MYFYRLNPIFVLLFYLFLCIVIAGRHLPFTLYIIHYTLYIYRLFIHRIVYPNKYMSWSSLKFSSESMLFNRNHRRQQQQQYNHENDNKNKIAKIHLVLFDFLVFSCWLYSFALCIFRVVTAVAVMRIFGSCCLLYFSIWFRFILLLFTVHHQPVHENLNQSDFDLLLRLFHILLHHFEI